MGGERARRAGSAVCAAVAIGLTATPSAGEIFGSKPHFSYIAGATSDYVFRGISQTSDRPSYFLGANVNLDDVYAGIWTSNVDFTPFGDRSTSEEIDLSVGLTHNTPRAQFDFDLGVVFVEYVNNPGHTNYWEAHAKFSRDFGKATIGAALAFSPAYPGQAGWAVYNEANAKYAISQTWSISAVLGSQLIDRGPNYVTWNIGPTYALAPNVILDVRYSDTDHHNVAKVYGERVIATITMML